MPQLRNSRRGFTVLEVLLSISIIAVLIGLLLAAIHHTQQSVLRLERSAWLRDRKKMDVTGRRKLPIRILFIGNSYTEANDFPEALKALAAAVDAKPALEVKALTPGGARLQTHWDQGDAQREIRDGDWDFVVFQEQSQTPLKRYGRDQFFYPYARKFHEVVGETDAIMMFFMTSARPDTPGPQKLWTDSYIRIARELHAEVAPAGMTWEQVHQSLPALELFADSGGHPTPAATYLIACTFYAAIYDKSPVGLPASITTPKGVTVSVPATDAAQIQQLAWDALKRSKYLLTKD